MLPLIVTGHGQHWPVAIDVGAVAAAKYQVMLPIQAVSGLDMHQLLLSR